MPEHTDKIALYDVDQEYSAFRQGHCCYSGTTYKCCFTN